MGSRNRPGDSLERTHAGVVMAIRDVVIGVDGTNGAQHAMEWAAPLMHELDAHVVAVHVISRTWLTELSALQIDTDEMIHRQRAQLVGPWTQPLRDASVRYTTECVRGDPPTELLGIAVQRHADLIVIGGTHHSGMRDALLGGTAHRVVNRTGIPVVVVPLATEPRPPAVVPIPG
jgi:nucleotide-binding universal stress UspA family protein